MGYVTDMNDIPTADLIESLSSIIEKRNGLISNGRCPYCGWGHSDKSPHTCKYAETPSAFQDGVYIIDVRNTAARFVPATVPLITSKQMAEEKTVNDSIHEFEPNPVWNGLCKHCGRMIGHVLHKEPKYAAPYMPGPRQAYVLPESAQQALNQEPYLAPKPKCPTCKKEMDNTRGGVNSSGSYDIYNCSRCGNTTEIVNKIGKSSYSGVMSDFIDMKAGKEEMLKFMQEHQDELRTSLGTGKVNKTRERIAELTAEVEHEKNKATISIGSLQQHIRELKEQKQGLRDDIDKLKQKTITDPELKPLTWMRINRQNTGHCEKFTLHCEAGVFQIDLPLMEFDHGSHSITEETLSACERLGICSNNYIPNTPGITKIKPLTFSALREANRKRLPLFKDKHGNICHKIPNVTDWTIDQWHTATSGELGEFANLVKKFNRGDLNSLQFHELARMELANVNTYLDMLADRCGIDLAQAIVEKFNEVSVRVGCDIRL